MLSGIAVWRLGTKYSTGKKAGYLILAKKLKIFNSKESWLFDLGQKKLRESHVSLKTNKGALTAANKAGYLMLAEKNPQ